MYVCMYIYTYLFNEAVSNSEYTLMAMNNYFDNT
jgi:hypothetical protein